MYWYTSHADEERQKILGFLGSADPKKNQETAIKLRQPGTGIWFTDGKEFKDWYSTKTAKLWLYGIRKCSLPLFRGERDQLYYNFKGD